MCNFQITLTRDPSEQPLSFAFNLVLITKQDSIPVRCISPARQPYTFWWPPLDARTSGGCSGVGPQVNKYEQVSSDDH